MSQHEMVAMEHLMAGPLGPSEVGHRVGVTTAVASGIVDRLEARGHVERRPHERGAARGSRSRRAGRREVLGLLTPMLTALADLDASLTDEERAVVQRYLEGVNASLRRLL